MKKVVFLFLLLGTVLTSKAADVDVYVSNTCNFYVDIDWYDGSCGLVTTSHTVFPGLTTITSPGPSYTPSTAYIYDVSPSMISCFVVKIWASWSAPCASGPVGATDVACCEPSSTMHAWWSGTIGAPEIHIN